MNDVPISRREGRSRRNKTYTATHQSLIEAAVRLISAKGIEALSVAELARSVEMNRATVYYHFASREELLDAVSKWSSQQLTLGFTSTGPEPERREFISRFVLDNPDLMKLWFEQIIAGGDIRAAYPLWDELVDGIRQSSGENGAGVDAEVYCTILLASAFIAPLVFRNGVRPDLSDATIISRFSAEQHRMLRRDGLPDS